MGDAGGKRFRWSQWQYHFRAVHRGQFCRNLYGWSHLCVRNMEPGSTDALIPVWISTTHTQCEPKRKGLRRHRVRSLCLRSYWSLLQTRRIPRFGGKHRVESVVDPFRWPRRTNESGRHFPRRKPGQLRPWNIVRLLPHNFVCVRPIFAIVGYPCGSIDCSYTSDRGGLWLQPECRGLKLPSRGDGDFCGRVTRINRSEEHTSELQSLRHL